ncbi:AgrD family cyclic lactone autoinducer peptide [Anaerobacillus alkalilacustris]|nr:cyclic lactone autoinducer peptide [Anaerobacillus alkalilacustris]
MKKSAKFIVSFIITAIVLLAKTEISSASTNLLYQPKLPKDEK